MSNGTSAGSEDPCWDLVPRHQYIAVKFALLSVLGATIGLCGVCGNLITTLVIMRSPMRFSANNLYLATLGVFDTLLLLPSLMLYSLEHVCEFFDLERLYVVWIEWVPYCFALGHFAQTGSVYITVSATFERYLAVLHPDLTKIFCTKRSTLAIIAGVFVFAGIFNSTKFFEICVARHPNCTGFASRELIPSDLLLNGIYNIVYTLWLSQAVMVFVPFGVLLAANAAIVCNFKRTLRRLSYAESWRSQCRKMAGVNARLKRGLKERSRDATRVLATIVSVFLICNSLGFVITLLEGIYGPPALHDAAPALYTFSRDAINFLAIFNASINFVVCCTFSQDFRRQLANVVRCRQRRVRHRLHARTRPLSCAGQASGYGAAGVVNNYVSPLPSAPPLPPPPDYGLSSSCTEQLLKKHPSSSLLADTNANVVEANNSDDEVLVNRSLSADRRSFTARSGCSLVAQFL